MNPARAQSSPDLASPSPAAQRHQRDDSALEGVAANVKLVLKLIQDHKEACGKGKNDSRRTLRVATMLTILDNVRDRIQKSQAFGSKAELQRCGTDASSRNCAPGDDKQSDEVREDDEKELLKKELLGSLAARKSLQVMCSSLGKEKEIIIAELSKKVQELSGMEELVNDLKAQNEKLLQKVQECASQHKKISGGVMRGGDPHVPEALQERNKTLSEQLLKSLDVNRAMKRKMKIAQEDNATMISKMDGMRDKVVTGLSRVRRFKERASECDLPVDVREEFDGIERVFEELQMMSMKHDKKQDD